MIVLFLAITFFSCFAITGAAFDGKSETIRFMSVVEKFFDPNDKESVSLFDSTAYVLSSSLSDLKGGFDQKQLKPYVRLFRLYQAYEFKKKGRTFNEIRQLVDVFSSTFIK